MTKIDYNFPYNRRLAGAAATSLSGTTFTHNDIVGGYVNPMDTVSLFVLCAVFATAIAKRFFRK